MSASGNSSRIASTTFSDPPGIVSHSCEIATRGKRARRASGVTRACEEGSDGEEEDLEVEGEGPVLDVVVVPFDAVTHRSVTAEAADLGPARHSGLDAMAVVVAVEARTEEVHELRPLRARPHEAHVAAQHVDQLRQLVEGGPAHEGADASAPIGTLDAARGDVGGQPHHVRLLPVVGGAVVHAHRAELEDLEAVAVAADAPLAGKGQAPGGPR